MHPNSSPGGLMVAARLERSWVQRPDLHRLQLLFGFPCKRSHQTFAVRSRQENCNPLGLRHWWKRKTRVIVSKQCGCRSATGTPYSRRPRKSQETSTESKQSTKVEACLLLRVSLDWLWFAVLERWVTILLGILSLNSDDFCCR